MSSVSCYKMIFLQLSGVIIIIFSLVLWGGGRLSDVLVLYFLFSIIICSSDVWLSVIGNGTCAYYTIEERRDLWSYSLLSFEKRWIPSFTLAPSQLLGLVCWDFSGHCQNPLANTTVTEFVTLFSSDIAKHLSLPPVKLHCSMLAEDAIKAAVKDYEAKKAKMGQKGEDSPSEKAAEAWKFLPWSILSWYVSQSMTPHRLLPKINASVCEARDCV